MSGWPDKGHSLIPRLNNDHAVLAYLFSHRPAAAVDIAGYEAALKRLHAALAEAGIPGFIASATFRGAGGYTDWYVLDDSASLDHLNDAAVSGDRTESHTFLARSAAEGVGKLLRLAEGELDIDARFEVRFSKPAGVPYDQLYETLRGWTRRPGVGLWRRMMVLGPAPEFALLCPERFELPAEMSPETTERRRV